MTPQQNIFQAYSKHRIEEFIAKIDKHLDKREPDAEIMKKLDKAKFKEELLSIAKARRRAKESKYKAINAKYFNLEDLQFSTPSDIADYRAKRLKCDVIVDLCSGIGIQSSAFSKHCKEVFAVEIDKRKVAYSKNNFPIKNIHFIEGDVLSERIIISMRSENPDIIFCDPERAESESERNLESIIPNIKKLVEIYSKITLNICLELPPQIDLNKLKELGHEFEAEYMSFNNKLNRLNVYFGNLKKTDISVVDVSGARIEKQSKVKANVSAHKPLDYLYEASTAILRAGLEKEFADKINAQILSVDKTKLLLTSGKLPNTNEAKALSKIYKVLGYGTDFDEIIKILKSHKIGKVILKTKVSPEEYWNERKKYEKNLSGDKEAHLFSVSSGKSNLLVVGGEI